MKSLINFLLWPAKPLIRRIRAQHEDRMTKLGTAINTTLKGIREVEKRKAEIEALTRKREDDLAKELENIMTSSTQNVFGVVCNELFITNLQKQSEIMGLHDKVLAAQKGEISQEGDALLTISLNVAEVVAYMAKSGMLNQGSAAFLESLRKQKNNIAMSEQAQIETATKIHNTITSHNLAGKEEAFGVCCCFFSVFFQS